MEKKLIVFFKIVICTCLFIFFNSEIALAGKKKCNGTLAILSFNELLSSIDQNTQIKDIVSRINSMKISSSDFKKIVKRKYQFDASEQRSLIGILKKIHKVNKSKSSPFSEFLAEVIFFDFIEKNLFKIKWDLNPDFAARRDGHPTPVHKIINRIIVLEKLSSKAIKVSRVKASDFFSSASQRLIDDIPVWTRVDIISWLMGPFASIRNARDLRKVIEQEFPQIKYKPHPEYGWAACNVYNPDAKIQLVLGQLYVKSEAVFLPGRTSEVDHQYLIYYPPFKNSEPIFLDYTISQHSRGRNNSFSSNNVFIGTGSDLGKFSKEIKDSTVLGYFFGVARSRLEDGITHKKIIKLKKMLNAK